MWFNLPEFKSFTGIIFAVTGNILISVSLNIQRIVNNEFQKSKIDQFNSGPSLYNSRVNSEHTYDSSTNSEGYEVLLDPDQYDKFNYFHSKAWWAGIFLMIIGEISNFIAFAFSPTSVVIILGMVALISNVILAPFMLKETFRSQDLLGILIAILSFEEIYSAIQQPQFIYYLIITGILALLLICLSAKIGSKFIIIDLLLAAIFGGYSVISAKAISSLLIMKFFSIFGNFITYFLLLMFIGTAVLQIKYLNRSLKRFDSTEIIPKQFVLFIISAIIGSAILYNDFAEMKFYEFLNFLIGCLFTFIGVYLITSNRTKSKGYLNENSSFLDSVRRSNNIFTEPFRQPSLPNSEVDVNNYSSSATEQRFSSSYQQRWCAISERDNPSIPLLRNYSLSRNEDILNSIVYGMTSISFTAMFCQILNSVGARHLHALGLVIEKRYGEESFNNQRNYGALNNSNSIITSSSPHHNNGVNNYNDSLIDNGSESCETDSKSLSTSYSNSSYFNSEYIEDDDRTVSGLTFLTNDSNFGIYFGETSSSVYNEFSGFDDFYQSDDMDNLDNLPDLPLR
ncbi:11047_t:CDS:2 [Diversispora eburnea]|uniref:11047_t:CDS:1 n=1 Tax=Diversispora eburnea TaxID=1213867 RepID=A0A9N9EY64_9GLOM|nr:11047_t:CDS:2 [Diversispora eburnea]